MDELQSDDLYVPEVLLNLLANTGTDEQNLEDLEDTEGVMNRFMKNVENWSEVCLVDERLE